MQWLEEDGVDKSNKKVFLGKYAETVTKLYGKLKVEEMDNWVKLASEYNEHGGTQEEKAEYLSNNNCAACLTIPTGWLRNIFTRKLIIPLMKCTPK